MPKSIFSPSRPGLEEQALLQALSQRRRDPIPHSEQVALQLSAPRAAHPAPTSALRAASRVVVFGMG